MVLPRVRTRGHLRKQFLSIALSLTSPYRQHTQVDGTSSNLYSLPLRKPSLNVTLSLTALWLYGFHACDMARGRLKEDAGALPCIQSCVLTVLLTNSRVSLAQLR
jgi:hypothetical protein